MNYSISKDDHQLLSGKPDICNVLDKTNEDQKTKLELFGFPIECPVPEGNLCMENKKHDISKFKALLPVVVGTITAKYDITHDTVRKIHSE